MRKSAAAVFSVCVCACACALAAEKEGARPEQGARTTERQLELLRVEIGRVENDLLSKKERDESAATQLRKIRRLVELQKKEIRLTETRVKELGKSLNAFSARKQELLEGIALQKRTLSARLRELERQTEQDPLDASWVQGFDAIQSRERYLSKIVEKDIERVGDLKRNADEAQALELRIIEEKGRLDYFLQEVREQNALMAANEQVQREILLTNRASRLESLKNLRELKSAEKELTGLLARFERNNALDSGFVERKGRLPFPAEGTVLSTFGRSYNSKTNLFTFQKGIAIGASAGTRVRSVASGKIAYAGPLKNYGQIVIVEHPGQYYTLYGQLGQGLPREGSEVRAGDVVGVASDEPVYFEIRNRNIAMNPLQWLSGGIALSRAGK